MKTVVIHLPSRTQHDRYENLTVQYAWIFFSEEEEEEEEEEEKQEI